MSSLILRDGFRIGELIIELFIHSTSMAQAALTVGDQEWKPWFQLGDGGWQMFSDEDAKLLESKRVGVTVILTHRGTICEATSKTLNPDPESACNPNKRFARSADDCDLPK